MGAIAEAKSEAEKISGRAAKGLEKASAISNRNAEAVMASWGAATKAMEAISAELLGLGASTFEAQLNQAAAFARVRSAQDLLQLQSDAARNVLEQYTAGVTRLNEVVLGSLRATAAPIKARVDATFREVAA
jgi:hypothetical protein